MIRSLLLLALVSSACARDASPQTPPPPWRGDDAFERGAWADAARSYEIELPDRPDAPDRTEAAYRLALAHLAVDGPGSRDRARTLLLDLTQQRVDPRTRRYAMVQLARLDALVRAETRLELRREQRDALRVAVERLTDLAAGLETRLDDSDERLRAGSAERERLVREVDQLKAAASEQRRRIHRLSEHIDRLTEQLDALKNIDLQDRR